MFFLVSLIIVVSKLLLVTGDNFNYGAPKMDARLAENLVRKWQMLKSQALGPNHAVARLSEVHF